MTVYGGIEAGGSKWECAVGTGTCRSTRSGDDSDDDSPGDHRPGRRLLRTRGAGRCDRDRLVRSRRPEAVVADLGPHHDDAEAGLGTHRRRAGDWPATLGARGLRYGRQRRRARRVPLGRGPGARHLLLHHRLAWSRGRDAGSSWTSGLGCASVRAVRSRTSAPPNAARRSARRRSDPEPRCIAGGVWRILEGPVCRASNEADAAPSI